jgi:hypothetical protein
MDRQSSHDPSPSLLDFAAGIASLHTHGTSLEPVSPPSDKWAALHAPQTGEVAPADGAYTAPAAQDEPSDKVTPPHLPAQRESTPQLPSQPYITSPYGTATPAWPSAILLTQTNSPLATDTQPANQMQPLVIKGSGHRYRLRPAQSHPRPLWMHMAVTLLAIAVLGGACYAAAPLSNGQHHWDPFSNLASIVDYAPTPTPTPTPRPVFVYHPVQSSYVYNPPPPNPGSNAVVADIEAVFGPYATSALAVARCESGYNPYAYNPSGASGVFQIMYPSTWDTTPYASESPFNYDANIHAAYYIFVRDGYSWREWQCQP